MALHRYFKTSSDQDPKLRGPLSKEVPSTSILSAKRDVTSFLQLDQQSDTCQLMCMTSHMGVAAKIISVEFCMESVREIFAP